MGKIVGNGDHLHAVTGENAPAVRHDGRCLVGIDQCMDGFALRAEVIAAHLVATDVCTEHGKGFRARHQLIKPLFVLHLEVKIHISVAGEAIDHDLTETVVIAHAIDGGAQRMHAHSPPIEGIRCTRARTEEQIEGDCEEHGGVKRPKRQPREGADETLLHERRAVGVSLPARRHAPTLLSM